MLIKSVKYATAYSARNPWFVLIASMALTAALFVYAWSAFDMTTDTGDLISSETQWRQDEEAAVRAFPGAPGGLVVVVDGETPELAEAGAAKLAQALQADNAHFARVARPDAGFFEQHALLYGSVEDVRSITGKLIAAQPLLGSLAADPSLRGIANALATAAEGAADDPDNAQAKDLAAPLAKIDAAVRATLSGKPSPFSWQQLLIGTAGEHSPHLRRIILIGAKLDYSDLQPGSAAVETIRAKAAALGLEQSQGVRVGITGEVPLADEEFGSIEEGMGLIGALMALAVALTLWFGTRSVKTAFAIMATIVPGLVITTALGLAMIGRLNLISVAFIPLFVGLGVDFGIQVSVRFKAERRSGANVVEALERSAEAVCEPILLAAGAICLALIAFIPTDYVGVSELGVISATGMIIALILNLTLLPALLVLLKPAPPTRDIGFAQAAPVDRWLVRNRRQVLWAFVLAMLVSIALLPLVRFDFNPLNLRNPDTPAMRQLRELLRDEQHSPNAISVVAPNVQAANELARRLEQLPEVNQAVTIDSLVPDQQEEKLALIQDAALLLDPAINPFEPAPPSDDVSTSAALHRASQQLQRLAQARPGELGRSSGLLAASFGRLAQAHREARERAEAQLVQPLEIMLNQIRGLLQAGPISRDSLPPEVVGDWIGKNGVAMVRVSPKGDSTDNAVLKRFTTAVRKVAPHATGMPVGTQEAARTVSQAFIQAGVLATVLVSLLLYAVLRSVREVAFTLAPVLLSMFLTLGTCVLIDQPLNFANIIAFPLLLGVGVAFHIYFVMAWRAGTGDLLQTSLARAVIFSALATGTAFGALWMSSHPGTASMGLILMISLIWTLVCALIFEPALLGPPKAEAKPA